MSREYAETQQFYALHNTLETQRAFLAREAGMVTSVLEGLPLPSETEARKADFVRGMEELVKEVERSVWGWLFESLIIMCNNSV